MISPEHKLRAADVHLLMLQFQHFAENIPEEKVQALKSHPTYKRSNSYKVY